MFFYGLPLIQDACHSPTDTKDDVMIKSHCSNRDFVYLHAARVAFK
jgi:hypothetical protein